MILSIDKKADEYVIYYEKNDRNKITNIFWLGSTFSVGR